jgi:hypothetical protein
VVAHGWNVDWLAGARVVGASTPGLPCGGFPFFGVLVRGVGWDGTCWWGGAGLARCWVLRERARVVWSLAGRLVGRTARPRVAAVGALMACAVGVPVVVAWGGVGAGAGCVPSVA